jgi:hypothetical protein
LVIFFNDHPHPSLWSTLTLIGPDPPTLASPLPDMQSSLVTTSYPGPLSARTRYLAPVQKQDIGLLSMVLRRLLGFTSYSWSCTPPSDPQHTCLLRQCQCRLLASNPVQHVEIDLHFIRNKVVIEEVCILHVSTTSQFADIFTKGMPSPLFSEFCSNLNICRG